MALESFHIERLSYAILVISVMLMTWAYLAGADESRYPPCPFNPLCRCSSAGPDLGVVICEDIPMADLPKTINMTKIHTFRMKRNELRRLEPNRFHGTGAYKVSICQNYMTEIPEDAWNGLQRSLWELNLQQNLLQKIPQKSLKDLQKLKVLDLTGNEITEVFREDFRGIESTLQSLTLAENSLTSIPQDIFRDMQRLEKLDLRGNNILSVVDQAFANGPQSLMHINLADNLLNKIPFTPLSQLKKLSTVNLARNKIQETFDVFFQGQLSVDTLILDYNNINKLIGFSFQNFGTLNKTSLQGNPIKAIDDDAFKEAKIKEISLRDCYIGVLAPKAFRGLETSLTKLDLGFNNLTHLPDKMFDNFDYLKTLSFNDNELSFNPEDSFNGFRYTLQSLNLVGHRMGNIPLKELNNMRNLRSIGLSSLPGDSISKDDFEGFGPALDSLYLARSNIKSIQANAFQHIPGLKTLDLSENRIATIDDEAFRDVGNSLQILHLTNGLSATSLPRKPFKSLVTLKELDLSNNRLNSLPEDSFHSMRELEELKLHDNKLDMIQRHLFESDMLPNLELLTLSFNHLKMIEGQTFADFEKLQKLLLDDNQVTRIDRNAFQNLEGLVLLNMEGNRINHIAHEAFQNLPKLEELNLAYNELKNFDIDALDQVGTLATLMVDISHNRIEKLSTNGSSWSSNSNVKILDFRYNNISKIADNYFDPIRSSLTHLYFGFNRLVNITKDVVRDMPHLQWLDFSNNKINQLDPESLRNTKKLQYLDFSNNDLDDIVSDTFADHPFLRVINLSGNEIKVIPEMLLKDTVVEFFDASHNEIIKFPDQTLQKVAETLKHLDLAFNNMTTLSASMFDKLTNLVYLDLSGNAFKTVSDSTFAGLASLMSLDLSHNPLGTFQHKALGGLQDTLRNLSLANASLTSLPELYLPNLHYFNVSRNKIAFLPPTSVANYSSVRLFDVSYCELSTGANNAWHTIPRLRRLFLQGNRIKSIVNDTFIGLDRLEEINLHDLPLQSFQYGALMPFSSLRTLHISSYRDISSFSIGNLIQHNHALRYIDIEVEDGTFDSELHGNLPLKLNNVTITGTNLKSFGRAPFKDITSRWLRLDITNTSIDKLDRKIFEQLGAARWLDLDVTGNDFKQVGEPSTTIYPGTPYSVFLTDLKMSNNDWNCDCGIGWVEYWMKKWRQYVCTDSRDANFEDCRRSIRDLRDSECRNKGNASFVDVLKTDLECGWSSSTHLVPNFSHVAVTLLIGFFTLRAV